MWRKCEGSYKNSKHKRLLDGYIYNSDAQESKRGLRCDSEFCLWLNMASSYTIRNSEVCYAYNMDGTSLAYIGHTTVVPPSPLTMHAMTYHMGDIPTICYEIHDTTTATLMFTTCPPPYFYPSLSQYWSKSLVAYRTQHLSGPKRQAKVSWPLLPLITTWARIEEGMCPTHSGSGALKLSLLSYNVSHALYNR